MQDEAERRDRGPAREGPSDMGAGGGGSEGGGADGRGDRPRPPVDAWAAARAIGGVVHLGGTLPRV
ncbi:MAG: hypothetical protein M9894_12420 [Planctomycetes bacterium]|nr:hypothetical protein [Planctomycetota bacterium]